MILVKSNLVFFELYDINLSSLTLSLLSSSGGLLLSLTVSRLASELGSSPGTAVLRPAVVELDVDSLEKGVEGALILLADSSEGNGGGGLLTDQLSESRLGLDDAVRNTHLHAQGREPDNELNRVDIMGNDNEGSLLVLNEGSDVVKTVLDLNGLVTNVLGTVLLGLGELQETLLLGLLVLRHVLAEKLDKVLGGLSIKSSAKLSHGRGDLHTVVQHALLALKTDVMGPLDEAGQVTSGLDVVAKRVVTSDRLGELGSKGLVLVIRSLLGGLGGLLGGSLFIQS